MLGGGHSGERGGELLGSAASGKYLTELRLSMFHSVALQLPGAGWAVRPTSLNASTTGMGACFEPRSPPLEASEKAKRMRELKLMPGVRNSGERIEWREVWQAKAREVTLRFIRHRLFPLSGEQCLTIAAPVKHAQMFNRSMHRAFGMHAKRSGAHKALKREINRQLVHWI